MKKLNLLLLIILFFSCRSSLITSNDQTLIDFIIKDYYSSQKKYINKYKYFEIDKHIIDKKCLYCYRVSPTVNNFYTPTITYDLFDVYPTHYKEYKSKTFFWRNNKKETPSKEVLNYLNSIGFIDSSYIKYELGQINRESIEVHLVKQGGSHETVNYVICKNDPNKVKKKIKVPAYYSFEELVKNIKCKCN